MHAMIEIVANWCMPLLLIGIPLWGYWQKIDVYHSFVEGAAEGFHTTLRIMPFLIAMLLAVYIFRESGMLYYLIDQIRPLLAALGVPPEIVPLALLRPLSGTGSLALTADLFQTYGPDSRIGKIASVILGSTDTTFYILTVYFGAVGIRQPRYGLLVGLTSDIIGFFASVYLCSLYGE